MKTTVEVYIHEVLDKLIQASVRLDMIAAEIHDDEITNFSTEIHKLYQEIKDYMVYKKYLNEKAI